MRWFWKKDPKVCRRIDPATKEEVLKLLAGVQQSHRSKFPALNLALRIGSGYAAMALLTFAALTFSAFSLYGIYNTAREIVYLDLPVVNSLHKLRTSVLAQENLARKYAILKDESFMQLFRQRELQTAATIEVLEKSDAVKDLGNLKKVYAEYQKVLERLLVGEQGSARGLSVTSVKLLTEIDSLSAKREEMLKSVLKRADRLRQETMKWTVVLSCCGFLIAILSAGWISYRIFRSLRRLQTATRHVAAGDFSYDPMIPVGEELSDLANDFREMAEKLQASEEMRRKAPAAGGGDEANGQAP